MLQLTFLPTDFTGQALANLREDESHQLITVPGKKNRAFVCRHGAFYSKTMKLRDSAGKLLVAGKDYKTVYHYADISKLTGKEVMGFVVVTNSAVTSPVKVTYQAFGGPFSISADELAALLDAVDDSKFPFTWGEIIGKPTEFVPADHMHKYWQLYGLETTVTQINRIADVWAAGNNAQVRENSTYADSYLANAKAEIDKYQQQVNAHLKDFANPHRVTPAQVQRENLNNWTFSTPPQIADPNNKTSYLPIGAICQILNSGPITELNGHISNFNNPHGTTAEMINAYTKGYVDTELTKKMKWTDTANDTLLFGGVNKTLYDATARTNIPASAITGGRFPPEQIGTGWPGNDPTNYALNAAQQWIHWSNFVAGLPDNSNKIVVIGEIMNDVDGTNLLNTSFTNLTAWPVGSVAIGNKQDNFIEVKYWRTRIWERKPNTVWELVWAPNADRTPN